MHSHKIDKFIINIITLISPDAFPDLNAVPKLHQLHLLERHGKRVKVIDMVAAEWDSVALRLHFESYDISRIERDHPQQCVQASITLFTEWIKGKGRQPSSWHTLIEALKETRLQSVASDLESIFGMLCCAIPQSTLIFNVLCPFVYLQLINLNQISFK